MANLASSKVAKQAMAHIEPDFKSIKQFTRLTMVFTNNSQIHQMINMPAKPADKATAILNTYDLIAIRTDEKALTEQAFTRSDADIITIDLSQRLNYFLDKTWFKLAIQRGVQFELAFGPSLESSECRKNFMMNAM